MTRSSVPISYESRIAKLSLNEAELPKVDSEFEENTEGEDEDRQQKLKTKWAALEALVGSEKRLRLIAEDLVLHFERRLEGMDGKAMVVCMSRWICVDLNNELIKLRPDWASAPMTTWKPKRSFGERPGASRDYSRRVGQGRASRWWAVANSDYFLSQCAAPQSLKLATAGPPFMEFARPTLPMR